MPHATFLLDAIDVDATGDGDYDCSFKFKDFGNALPDMTAEIIATLLDDILVEPPRGTMTKEERKRRRRERRQSPTAKVKESKGRARRKDKKDALRQRWFERERQHRALAQSCLAHARTAEQQKLCVGLLRESDAAVQRGRELCPKALREKLNAIPRWCVPRGQLTCPPTSRL